MSIEEKDTVSIESSALNIKEGSVTSRLSSLKNGMSGKKYIRYAIIVAIIVVILALGYTKRGIFIAATVNGSPISRMSIIREMEKQSGSEVLDGLITRKLIEAEIKKKGIKVTDADIQAGIDEIKQQLKEQGTVTLEDALSGANITEADLKEQIWMQKGVEKLFAEQTNVTDAQIETYIKDNKVQFEKGKEDATKEQIKKELQQQKLSEAIQKWLGDVRNKADIRYFGNYKSLEPVPTASPETPPTSAPQQ